MLPWQFRFFLSTLEKLCSHFFKGMNQGIYWKLKIFSFFNLVLFNTLRGLTQNILKSTSKNYYKRYDIVKPSSWISTDLPQRRIRLQIQFLFINCMVIISSHHKKTDNEKWRGQLIVVILFFVTILSCSYFEAIRLQQDYRTKEN